MGTRGVGGCAVDGRFMGTVLVASCFSLLACSSDDCSEDAQSEGRSAGAGGAPERISVSNAGGVYRSDGTRVSSGGLLSSGVGGNTAEATYSLDASAGGGMGGSSSAVATAGAAGHGGVSTESGIMLGSGGSSSQGGSGDTLATTPAITTGGITSTGNRLYIGGTSPVVTIAAGGTLTGGASAGGTSGLLSGGAINVAGTVSSSTSGGSFAAGGTHGVEGGTVSAYAGAAWSSGGTTNGGTLAYGGEGAFGGTTSFGGADTAGSAGEAGAASAAGWAGTAGSAGTFGTIPEPNLLIAFLGDQGNNTNADRVLELVKSEGAAAAIHNGDFDYVYSPSAWNSRIDAILGPEYPYFAVVGNHDAAAWDGTNGYATFINARMARVPEMQCEGDIGVKAICRFRGLFMLQSCVGTNELLGHGNCAKDSAEQTEFLRDALANDHSLWSVCNWHKNQNDMQIGTKPDEVGWNAYRECMFGGALIATGHEHSYSRTLGLTDMGNRALGHGAVGAFDELWLFPGQSFVFVSGLGGVGMRAYDSAGHDDDTWWAAQYASNRWLKSGTLQTAGVGTYGALFVRFHVDGDPRLARGYFKDVNGRIADEFTIRVP